MINKFDIVFGEFPFEDTNESKARTMLCLDNGLYGLINAKVTKNLNKYNNTDYIIKNWKESGLSYPSKVQLKTLATTNADEVYYIGHLSDSDILNIKDIMLKDPELKYLVDESLKSNITESINTDDDSMTETTTQIEKSDEGIKSLINDALKYCWGLYNSLTTLRINADAYGYKDIGENVKELEDSQYTNIGTLEGLLQTLDPNAETINDSSEEVVDEIEGAENG